MSDIVIQVENLGKKYVIGHQQPERYTMFRDALTNQLKSLANRLTFKSSNLGKSSHAEKEEFWALKDISFEVKQGDRIGIIGRNGAGKSTLLKILSRITEPTTGRIKIKGRVASLLEVGTGFHPELTGRENIFLNGAILGMSKAEISRKFDEIVAFAEIERFLDTPVKRYSSGMYVRLAFSVAAHLEPEILVVDEVLAVGDASFQKKCLGKMEEVGKEGRTVIFVSHQMGVIAQLCNYTFLLHQGSLISQGDSSKIIAEYLSEDSLPLQSEFFKRAENFNHQPVSIVEAFTTNDSGKHTSEFSHLEPVNFVLKGNSKLQARSYHLTISVKDKQGRRVFSSQKNLGDLSEFSENWQARLWIPAPLLTPGFYTFLVSVSTAKGGERIDRLDDICRFKVTDTGSEFSMFEGGDYGCVFAPCKWYLESLKLPA